MQQFREISRTRTTYSTERHTSDLYLIVIRYEMGSQCSKSCSKVLNFLERLDDRIRCTREETVAVVKP